MKRLSLVALLLLASVAHAAKVPFTAQLDSFSDTAAKAYVKLTFLNKFQCIPIGGGAGLARAEDKLFPATGSTSVSKMIVPNSDYTCGGVGNSTSYMVEIFQISEVANKPDIRLFGGETIIGPAGFDIATAQWVPPNPPPVAIFDYAIRNGNNTFTPGTTQDFTGVTVLGLSAGSGSVTSVGLAAPGEFTVTGSPVTGTGSLTFAWQSQTANKVLAAPSGSSGVPSFRALVALDIPALPYLSSSTVLAQSITTVAHKWLDSYNATTGAFTQTQPDYGDLTGLPQLAVTKAAVANFWLRSYDSATGLFTTSRPACADLSNAGTLCSSSAALAVTKTAVAGSPLLSYDSTTGAFTQGALTAAQVGAMASTQQLAVTKTAVSGSPLLSYDSTTGLFTQGALTAAQVGLGSVTNDAQTKAAVVPNTAPSGGQLLIGNVGGTAYAPITTTGCTFTAAGAVTCTPTAVGLSAVTNDAQTKAAVVPNTLTLHALYAGNSTSAISAIAVPAADSVLYGTTAVDPSFKALPTSGTNGCAGTGDKLLFNTTTHAFSCGVDQGAGGGMTNPMTTLGDIIYEDATPTPARLAGNTTTTKKYLSQTGNGSISAVPAWNQPACADLSNAGTLCTSSAALPVTKTAVAGQPLLSYDSTTGAFTQGALTATNVGLGSVTNDAQTKAAVVPNTAPTGGQVLIGNVGGTAYAPITTTGCTFTAAGAVTCTPTAVGLSAVTNDAQTKAAVVPNTAPTAGQVLVGNAGNTAYAPVAMSQDCTIASTGVVTCTKTNNVAFGGGATMSTTAGGDLSGTLPSPTVAKVNGIAYSATAAAHAVEVITTANTTATAKVIPDCTDTGGNHLNFTQSTDAFSCGTSGSGGAPTTAKYILQTADGSLPNAQAMGALGTGIVKNTTTTGVQSIAIAADFPTLNQNTSGSAATLTTPRSIYGNNFDGSAALAQIIASTFGGTGNGFTKFSGPATTEKTFTLPNATATILTDNALVTVAQGGTGLGTLTAHALYAGNGAAAPSAVSVPAADSMLYGTTGVDPSFKAMPTTGTNGCAGSGEALQWNSTTHVWACITGLATGGTPTYPQTVAGTVTSGGIPYFNSTTQSSSSALLTSNVLVKGGGAGGAPANSSITDNGTTVATAEPIVIGTANCTTFGTGGGACLGEGTAPTNVASTMAVYADSTTHEIMAATAGSSTFGILNRTAGSVNLTGQTATKTISTACAASAGACNVAGLYELNYTFWGSGTACSSVTAGKVVLVFTWTDENGTAHTSIPAPMAFDQKAAAANVTGTFNFNTALGTEGAYGAFPISSNGAAAIQYTATYTACTTGTGTYNLRIATTRLQ